MININELVPVDSVKAVQVIITANQRRGKGTADDICRVVHQIWTMDGQLIFEIDPCPDCKSETNQSKGGVG
jgi:hypothetical protein